MNKTLRGIFFDLYGTILIFDNIEQSWKDWAATYYGFLKSKTALSFEAFCKSCDGLMSRNVLKSPGSRLSTYETRLNNHCKELSISLTPSELRQIADETPKAWQKYITISKDAIQTLLQLKENHILALITNFDHAPHIKQTLSHFNLNNIFNQVIVSDEVGCAKPDKAIFQIALHRTNLKPEEVVFVGDSPKDDIEGAQSAGITPIFIKYETFTTMYDYNHSGESNDAITLPNVKTIHSLKELLEF